MTDVVAIVVFAGFLLTASMVRWSRNRTRAVNLFVLWAIGSSFLAGLTQRDLFPFAAWPLVAGTWPDTVTQYRMVLVDEGGEEHDVDYRAWYPLSYDELLSWMRPVFLELGEDDQAEAAAHLVERVERARLRARETGSVGDFDRFLGPFTAPFFLRRARQWTRDGPPDTPIVGLAYYRERWSPEMLAVGADSIRRETLYRSGPAR